MKKYLAFREYGEILESLKKMFEKSGVMVKLIPSIAVCDFSRFNFCICTNEQIAKIYEKVVRRIFEVDKKERKKLVKYLGKEKFKIHGFTASELHALNSCTLITISSLSRLQGIDRESADILIRFLKRYRRSFVA